MIRDRKDDVKEEKMPEEKKVWCSARFTGGWERVASLTEDFLNLHNLDPKDVVINTCVSMQNDLVIVIFYKIALRNDFKS